MSFEGPKYNDSQSLKYREATNQLYILVVSVMLPAKAKEGGTVALPDLHCMRVNTTKLSDLADLDGDSFTMTSEALQVPAKSNASPGRLALPFAMMGWATVIGMLYTMRFVFI